MIGIYKITNPHNKVYIGQSIDINARFLSHKNAFNLKSNTKLYNSFKEYGYGNHKFEVLEECNMLDLNKLERFYQEKYDSVNTGLNLCYTTTDTKSGLVSEEVRQKISKSKRGVLFTSDHKEKLRQAKIGIVWSQETLNKRANSMLGKNTVKVTCLNDGNIFKSIKEATEFYKLKYRSYIEDVCAGRRPHIKGLVFEKI